MVIGAQMTQAPLPAQATPQSRPIVRRNLILWSTCHRGKSVKIRAILVASLIALDSSSALAEPLLRSIFGGAAPPRPRRLIGRAQSVPGVPADAAVAAGGGSSRQTGAEVRCGAGASKPQCSDDRPIGRGTRPRADREHAGGAQLPAGAETGVIKSPGLRQEHRNSLRIGPRRPSPGHRRPRGEPVQHDARPFDRASQHDPQAEVAHRPRADLSG